jgi:hypothetical protein
MESHWADILVVQSEEIGIGRYSIGRMIEFLEKK